MTVKIVIKRQVPRDKEKELLPLIKELRIATTRQAGYISGETLRRTDKPGETVVISTWETAEDWDRWMASQERSALQVKIDTLLGQKTEYKIYSHINSFSR
jgi:quinol monooxygenase YgiN